MQKLALYVAIGCGTFLAVLLVRIRDARPPTEPATRPGVDAPVSLQLDALGIRPGAQLIAFVFGGSRFGFCQKPETKQALAELRTALSDRYVRAGVFQSVSVVGIAVNTDLREGLEYLTSIGAGAFNEISVGSGWQNEHIVRLLRRERFAEPAVPLVILVSRFMDASLAPLRMTYGTDSVVKVVQGASQIVDWVNGGVLLPLTTPPQKTGDQTRHLLSR